MSGTDMSWCLINSLPSEKVRVLTSEANDDHWGQQRRGRGIQTWRCSYCMQRQRVLWHRVESSIRWAFSATLKMKYCIKTWCNCSLSIQTGATWGLNMGNPSRADFWINMICDVTSCHTLPFLGGGQVKASTDCSYDLKKKHCDILKTNTPRQKRQTGSNAEAWTEGGSELESLIRPDIECSLCVWHKLGLKGEA